MKAAALESISPNAQLKSSSLPMPELQQGTALIQVEYCGVNHLDHLIRIGRRPGPTVFPHVLGSEITGRIEKIPDNSAFTVGQRVAVYPWTFCGECEQCRNGQEQICDKGGTIGRTSWGGYAEYVRVPLDNLIPYNESLDSKMVCAGVLAGTTAIHLIERANVLPQSTVLVTGATGGVGTLLIQLLRHLNCRVLAVTSSETKKEYLNNLGVEKIYSIVDFQTTVRSDFPKGVDSVIDIMGGSVWSRALTTLKKNGTMAYCSTTLDGDGAVPVGLSFSNQWNIHGSYGGNREHLSQYIEYLDKGILNPSLFKVFPIEQAQEAHTLIAEKRVSGKLLLSFID